MNADSIASESAISDFHHNVGFLTAPGKSILVDKGVKTNGENELMLNEKVKDQIEAEEKMHNEKLDSNEILHSSSPTAEDVTMDYSYGISYKSPCVSLPSLGATSPATQGRSVREFEEQMAALRKENFNLKLRLYFMEEGSCLPGYQQLSSPEGKENSIKQLIDMKVEIEMLRKETQEKQDLLRDAAQAMSQMEIIQKETEAKSQAIAEALNKKIQLLEMDRNSGKSPKAEFRNEIFGNPDDTVNVKSIQRIHQLEDIVKESEEKLSDFQHEVSKLDVILQKRDETIKEYEDKVRELVFQNAELLESMENKEKEVANVELERMRNEFQQQKLLLADRTCLLQEAEEQLKNRTQIHEKACRTIQKLMLNIANQQDEIHKLKNNTMQVSNQTKKSQANVDSIGFNYVEFSDTDKIKNDLSAEEKQKYHAKIAEQETTIRSLKDEIKKKNANLQNLVNKELWEKNREIERLSKLITNAKECSSPVLTKDTTTIELQQEFSETEYLKALESNKELQKKVDVLIQRLSANRSNDALITHLQRDTREARQEAKQAEKWRRECVDVCSILSNRLEELANFLKSLLKHKDLLGLLATDSRKAMRKAVDQSLDLSKSVNMTLSMTATSMTDYSLLDVSHFSVILGDLSQVENKTFNSHEKIQTRVLSFESLEENNRVLTREVQIAKDRPSEILKKECCSNPLGYMANQSESESWSEPDRNVSMARIGLEEPLTKNASATLPKLGDFDTDSETDVIPNRNLYKTSLTPIHDLERINQLEHMIKQRDERILDIQCQLVDADTELKREQLKGMDATQEVERLRRCNEDLCSGMTGIGFERNQNLYLHDQQGQDKSHLATQIMVDREAQLADTQIEELHTAIKNIKLKYEESLAQAEEKAQRELEQQQINCNRLLKSRLDEQQLQHEEVLARDWISRTVYEEIQQQMKKLQEQLNEALSQIQYLKENEAEMKQTLISSELEIRVIRKQLDGSTMEASKAVLERTKALNENLKLEKRVHELSVDLHKKEVEIEDMLRKIEQHSNTQVKLRQELNDVRAQAQNLQPCNILNSGYTSEELPKSNAIECSADASSTSHRVTNPSPDLGIESDAGRVLSVEFSKAEHSNLKAVELYNPCAVVSSAETKTDVEGVKPSHNCTIIDKENIDLRQQLIRTKRALKDTYEKLRFANQKKAQVEKDIKNQILKTHNVLRNVRSNMENEF